MVPGRRNAGSGSFALNARIPRWPECGRCESRSTRCAVRPALSTSASTRRSLAVRRCSAASARLDSMPTASSRLSTTVSAWFSKCCLTRSRSQRRRPAISTGTQRPISPSSWPLGCATPMRYAKFPSGAPRVPLRWRYSFDGGTLYSKRSPGSGGVLAGVRWRRLTRS
jgi:hypothetical protein